MARASDLADASPGVGRRQCGRVRPGDTWAPGFGPGDRPGPAARSPLGVQATLDAEAGTLVTAPGVG
ncbi:hypothetical protein ACQEVC_44015 [Plantactinospora sp. CA-294935]|uniref:hypothetical protein n=1 Tax=Plantactinospora sp. CA-294935 TaxID=3240012 RepID=UPI003D949939